MYADPLMPPGDEFIDELRWVFEVVVNKPLGFDENANFVAGSQFVNMQPPYTFNRLTAADVGQKLSAPFIPTGTTLAEYISNTQIRMSQAATQTVQQQWFSIGAALIFWGFQFGEDQNRYSSSITSGSPILTSSSAFFDVWDVGRQISGTGIPTGTTVLSRQSATQITLSQNATATATTLIFMGISSGGHAGHQMNSGGSAQRKAINAGFYGPGGGPLGQTDGIVAHYTGTVPGTGIDFLWQPNRQYLYRTFRSPVQNYPDVTGLWPPGSLGTRPTDVVWRTTLTDLTTGVETWVTDRIDRHAKPTDPMTAQVFWSEDFETFGNVPGGYQYPIPYEGRWTNIQYRRSGSTNWYSVNRFNAHYSLRAGLLPVNADIFVTAKGLHQKAGTPRVTNDNTILTETHPVVGAIATQTFNATTSPLTFSANGGNISTNDRLLLLVTIPASRSITTTPTGWTLLSNLSAASDPTLPRLYIYTRTGGATVTTPPMTADAACDWAISLVRYRCSANTSATGAPVVSTSDASNSPATGVTTWTTPSATRTKANSRMLHVVASSYRAMPSGDLSYTIRSGEPYPLSAVPMDAAPTSTSLLGIHVGTECDVAPAVSVAGKQGGSAAAHNYVGVQIELPMTTEGSPTGAVIRAFTSTMPLVFTTAYQSTRDFSSTMPLRFSVAFAPPTSQLAAAVNPTVTFAATLRQASDAPVLAASVSATVTFAATLSTTTPQVTASIDVAASFFAALRRTDPAAPAIGGSPNSTWEVRVYSGTNPSTLLGVVPTWTAASLSQIISDVGNGEVSVNLDDPFWRDPANRAWLDGENLWALWWRGVERMAFWGEDCKEDRVVASETRAVTVSGRGVAKALEWGTVLSISGVEKRQFRAYPAMAVFVVLFTEAKARGCFPWLTLGFDAQRDSAGQPWTDRQDIDVEPGQNLFDVLKRHTDLVTADWAVGPDRVLRAARNWGKQLESRVAVQTGNAALNITRSRTRRDLRPVVYVEGGDNAVSTTSDSGGVTTYGRRELYIQAAAAKGPTSRDDIAASVLRVSKTEQSEISIEVVPDQPGRTVFEDFGLGDWIKIGFDEPSLDGAYRTLGIGLSIDEDGATTGHLTLQSILERLSQRLTRLLAAQGLSTSGPSGPQSPVPETPELPDGGTAPNPTPEGDIAVPTGLSVTSGSIGNVSFFDVTWTPLGGKIVDYVVLVQRVTDAVAQTFRASSPPVRVEPVIPGEAYAISVRSIDTTGAPGPYSDTVIVIAATDPNAPSQVTGLSIAGGIQSLTAVWDDVVDLDVRDGLGTYEIQLDTTNTFDSPNLRTLRTSGTVVAFTDLPATTVYYARVRAIDTSRNEGMWSVVASTNTGGIGSATLEDASVTTAKLANNAVSTAKLAALAVDAAALATSAVTATKIANAAVGSAAIANLAVGTIHVADGAILAAKIGDAQITNAKIGNLAVDSAKIADLAVGTAKIANGSITNAKIFALDVNKLTAGSINVVAAMGAGGSILVGTPGALAVLDFVPTMTGPTTPSGAAAASSEIGSNEAAWNAFDANQNTKWLNSGGSPSGWLRYDFGTSAATVNSYAIRSANDAPLRTPTAWTFEGSYDATTWTVLDTRTAQTGWGLFEQRIYQITSGFNTFRYFRLNITANGGGGEPYVGLSEFLIGALSNPPSSGVLIDRAGIRLYSGGTVSVNLDALTGSGVFRGTIESSVINSSLITAGKFRTASSGARIELSDSSFDRINFFGYTPAYEVISGYIAIIPSAPTGAAAWNELQLTSGSLGGGGAAYFSIESGSNDGSRASSITATASQFGVSAGTYLMSSTNATQYFEVDSKLTGASSDTGNSGFKAKSKTNGGTISVIWKNDGASAAAAAWRARNADDNGYINVMAADFIVSSARSTKFDIRPDETGALACVRAIPTRRYKRLVDGRQSENQREVTGFIADEVEKIIPHVVMTDADGPEGLVANGMLATLWKAVQELADKVDDKKGNQ